MGPTPDQLTKLPICPICHREQLTNEELALAPDIKMRSCWFCKAETLIGMGLEDRIPEPSEYGRPNISKADGIASVKQKYFRAGLANIAEAIDQATVNSPVPTGAAGSQSTSTGHAAAPAKPLISLGGAAPVKFDESQRTEFATKFGMDPLPKNQPYEIIVHGATEDTYMKFVCPVPVDLAEQREIQRIMGAMLEIFGKLLKYGAQFAATLIELQNMSAEMFLGGRR